MGTLVVLGAILALAGCAANAGTNPPAPGTTAAGPSTGIGSTSSTTTTKATSSSTASRPTSSPTEGSPVAPGFRVQSATFISAHDGWVLGMTTCTSLSCGMASSPAEIARTIDAGAHWVLATAPPTHVTPTQGPSSGVSELRFADARDGWAYGPDLWSTHDGGSTWTKLSIGVAGSHVVDLEAAGGEVDAVVTHCASTAAQCPAKLWHSPVKSDNFTQVVGVGLPEGGIGPGALALHGKTGYLVSYGFGPSGSHFWVTTNGTTWSLRSSPCTDYSGANAAAPVDASRVDLLCVSQGAAGSTRKQVLVSTNAGHSFVPTSVPEFSAGDGGRLSAASASTLGLATSSAAAWIERSTNGGASFTTSLTIDDGGAGWGDFGFTDATQGFVVHDPANRSGFSVSGETHPATLYMTFDGGVKWVPITI